MRINHSRLAAAAGLTNPCRFLSGHFSKPFFLLLATCWLLTAQGLHAQTVWDGSESTDWFDDDNWSAGVPDATDAVTIPGSMPNNPVISMAAVARQISIGGGGNLMVAASGSLAISGGSGSGIFNVGTVVNEGTISINGISGFGLHNLIPGSFTNKNLLQIGNLSGVGDGIYNDDATFINQGGSITLDRCSGSAIKIYTLGFQNTIFTNDGSITIGSLGTIGSEAISVTKACGGGCQASFTNTSCSAFINIVASAVNNIITVSGGAIFDNNGGRIIENSNGNCTITSNSGVIQSLGGGTFNLTTNTGAVTSNSGDVWTGCTSTDWATATNWLDGSVPTATDAVDIVNVPNKPIIMAGTAAVAKSVTVQPSSSLSVNASGSLAISGSTNNGLLNAGTVTNEGTISINNTANNGLHNLSNGSFINKNLLQIGNIATVFSGILNRGTFINQSGSITIDRTTSYGIVQQDITGTTQSFTNNAAITFGSLGLIGDNAILVDQGFGTSTFANTSCTAFINIVASASLNVITLGGGATFNNNGGRIIERSSGNSTITSNSGSIQNLGSGVFIITTNTGMLTTGTGDIWTGCTSTDWATATNWLDGSVPTATDWATIPNVTNDPTISTAALAQSVTVQGGAVLTNMASLTIDGSATQGILNSGTVENSGILNIGQTTSPGFFGLINQASFNNHTGGEINIDRSTNSGLWNAAGIFTNAAAITIGAIAGTSPGQYGLRNEATFNNSTSGGSGVIHIDRSTNSGLYNENGTFTNEAAITIGAVASVGSKGIRNPAIFNNSICSALINIVSNSVIDNSGTFTNAGGIIENASGNSSITSNSGIVQNLNGGTFTIGSGNAAITTPGPQNPCCPTITFTAPTVTQPTCATPTGTIVVNASSSGTLEYSVNNGVSWQTDATFSGLAGGNYILKARLEVSLTCEATYGSNPVILNSSSLPSPEATITGGGTYCGGTSVSLSAPVGAASYAWGKYNNLTGAPGYPQIGTGNPFSVTKSGLYSVTVTNAAGCSAVGFTDVIVADYTINGSLGPGDTQKPDRLLRIGASGVTCAVPKSCPGTTGVGEVHYYDVHNFTNTQNAPVCVTIAINSPCGTNIFMAAYSAPFNPANTCANYLGDPANSFFSGQTGTMEVTVVANGTLSVLVEVVSNGGTCSDYTLAVDILAAFPGLTVTAPNAACQGTAFNLSATAFSNAAYSWAGSGVTASTTNATTATPSATGSQTYSVTVSTISGCKSTTASKTVSVGAIPGCPSSYTPGNGTTAVAQNLGSLQWSAVAGATSYQVYFGTNAPNYDNIANGTSVPGTSFTIGMLSTGTTYGYRIVPVNSCGPATGCPTVTFSTCVPTFTCPVNQNVNLNANCSMVIPDLVTGLAATPGCGTLTFTQSPAAGTIVSSSHNGTVSVVITPINPAVTSCTVTLTGKDVTVPAITCPANIVKTTDASQCNAVTTYSVTASDNCAYTLTRTSPAGTASGSAFPTGMTNVVWSVTDPGGNATSCAFTVTVTDGQTPTITCPANIAKNTDAGQCNAVTTYTVTANDNCSYTLTQTGGLASGAAFPTGVNTVTWKATDPSSNSTVCSFTVTVTDAQTPTITCPANIAKTTDAGQCSAVTNYTVTAIDNCSYTLTQTGGLTSGAAFPAGVNTVTWKATDPSSNSTVCSFTVTVTDAQAPTITCPANIAKTTDAGQCSAVTTYSVTASDNCSYTLTRTSPAATASGSSFPLGMTHVAWSVTDADGNASSCAFTVTVTDGQGPGITCPANIAKTTDAGQCSAVTTYSVTASDNCSYTLTQTGGLASGASFPAGMTTVSWKATDPSSNSTVCSFTVTVTDAQAPTITCPANIAKTTDAGQCSAVTTYSVTASDNCSYTLTRTNGFASGSSFPAGMTTVNWKVTDVGGNSTVCSFTVTVTDGQLPSIVCPGNISKTTDLNQCSALTTYANPTFSDNCGGVSLTRTGGLASGSAFPKGTTMVNWKATDTSGNSSVCGFTVTVTDGQLPTISCPANMVKNADAGLCTAVATYANPGYSDNCAGAGVNHISGGLSGSAFPKGTTSVIWQATDGAGLTKRCTFTITVNDNQAPVITCPGNQTKSTDAGLCTAVTTYTTPTFTDNCAGGSAVFQSGLVSGSAFPKGMTTVVWRATDAAGMTKTCSFHVTVNDTQAPAISCPANQAKTTDSGLCTAVATYNLATFTDNCAGGTVVKWSGLNSGSAFPKGINQVVFKATDAAGNQSLCTMTVTVTDAQLPTVACPANIVVTGTISSGVCSATVVYTNPTASDNCGLQSSYLWSGLASGSVFPQGVTTNVWRATDEGGLTATCAFTVTVGCGTGQQTMNDELGTRNDEDATRSLSQESRTDLTTFLKLSNLDMRLTPNPATTMVMISVEGLTESDGTITVFDAQGRVVWQQSNVQHPTSSVNVSDLPSGLYQVRLQTENGVVTKGLVVSRL